MRSVYISSGIVIIIGAVSSEYGRRLFPFCPNGALACYSYM